MSSLTHLIDSLEVPTSELPCDTTGSTPKPDKRAHWRKYSIVPSQSIYRQPRQKTEKVSGTSWWLDCPSRETFAAAIERESPRMRASRDGQQSLGKAPLGVGSID